MGRYSPMKHQEEGADGPDQETVGGSSLETTTLTTGHSSLNLSSVVQLRPDPNDGSMVQTSVISVPGYQTPPVRKWGLRNELETAGRAVDALSRLHIYIHRPVFDEEDVFSWEKFLEAGNDLAEDVARLSTEFPERPIIFIAHSLGGVLLKKALLLTHQNIHDKRFKLVVDCLSGILFLGTPHCGTNDDDTLLRHNRVLHNCAKFAMQRRSSRLPAKDVFQLANLAATFQQIATIPVLSVYETDYQRTGVYWPFKGKKKVLVDKETATVSAQIEHFLGVHLSHMELCNLSKLRDQTYSARGFLRSLLEAISTNRRPSDQPSSSGYDPLNPLNLADIEPPERIRGASLHGNVRTIGSSSESIRTSQRLPRRLRHVPSNSDRLLQSRTCRLPCFSLASYSRNPDFIGRTGVFSRMDQYLLPRPTPTDTGEAQTSRVFSLCGMGGVGKTDLAIEYAYTRQDAFGAVFWLEAGGVSQLISDFAGISIKLGLESPEEAQDLESSRAIVKAWLNSPSKTPNRTGDPGQSNYSWLLIFDNADTLDIIADYIPYYGNGSILITSRDPFAKTHFFSNGQGIDLEPLPTGDAAYLLQRLTKGTDETPDREEHQASVKVATQLDGLPLAMTQMAGFIRRRHLTISEYVELYASDTRYADVRTVGNPMQDNRYGHTLATTYSFEGLGNHSTRLLKSLAFMNPDRVQEEIYLGARRLGGRPEDGGDDGEGQVWTAPDFESARYELLGSSIIKRNIDKKELWIHRVIQAEVRARMDKRTRYETFRQVLALLTKAWPPGDLCSQASERWAICEKLFPHLERFYQMYNEHATDWGSFDIDPIFPTLLNEAAVYLHERGFSHEGKMYLQLALDLCERGDITSEPLISDMHLTMGALCNETNDAEGCLEHNILCLALRKAESVRKKTPDLRLAFAHSQMGIAYMMIRKFALATEYFKQCVEMLKGLDVDVDEFGFPSCNLGLAYWVQGQYETADQVLTDLLQQREERHGKLDRVSYKTGRVLQALGNVKASRAKQLEARGKDAEAKSLWDEVFYLHSECLKQYEATLGLFNHRTADACHKLAEYHIRFGQDDLAQEYLDRALGIWGDRQWFRNESARSSFLRGTHLQTMGGKQNAEEGKRLVERAVALRKQILADKAGKKDLEMEDFDDLVCFWSI